MKYVKFLATLSKAALACSVPTVGLSMFATRPDCFLHLYDGMQRSVLSYVIYQYVSIIPLLTILLT